MKPLVMVTFWDIKRGPCPLDVKNVGDAIPNNDEEQGLLGAPSDENDRYRTLSNKDNVGDAASNKCVNDGDAALKNGANGCRRCNRVT